MSEKETGSSANTLAWQGLIVIIPDAAVDSEPRLSDWLADSTD